MLGVKRRSTSLQLDNATAPPFKPIRISSTLLDNLATKIGPVVDFQCMEQYLPYAVYAKWANITALPPSKQLGELLKAFKEAGKLKDFIRVLKSTDFFVAIRILNEHPAAPLFY
ncbi:MAG: hypothetical protein K1000chlam4_00149 [Chlamydiae bacterium]|nr:hypothetical protein [Chlamydiota bacterium]